MKAAPIRLVPILLATLLPGAAAAGLSVSEADFGGEFSSSGHAPTWVGTLGLGVNTISGRYDGSPDFDHVSATLPQSLAVVEFVLTTSEVAASPGSNQAFVEINRVRDRLVGAAPTVHALSPLAFVEGGVTSFGIATEFPNGTRSFDYVWKIVTAPNRSVSFLASTLSVPQAAGQALLRVRYAGTPSPPGTADFRVRLVDGTARAGSHYGDIVRGGPPAPRDYDVPATRELAIPVPVHLLRRRTATFFTAELQGLNGATVADPSTATVVIEAWHPSPRILRTIRSLERRIRKLKRNAAMAGRASVSRRAGHSRFAIVNPRPAESRPDRSRRAASAAKSVPARKAIRRLSLRLSHLKSSIRPLSEPPRRS